MTTDKSGLTSAGILLWRVGGITSRCCSPTKVGRFRSRRVSATGRSRKVRPSPVRNSSRWPVANTPRRPDTRSPTPRSFSLDRSDKSQATSWFWAWTQPRPVNRREQHLRHGVATTISHLEAFPEIDRVEWFDLDEARRKLKAAQVPFLDRLHKAIATDR